MLHREKKASLERILETALEMLPVRRFNLGSERHGASAKRRTAVQETARKQQKFRLRLHDKNYLGGDELLVNPDFFPDLRQGDLVSISVVENGELCYHRSESAINCSLFLS